MNLPEFSVNRKITISMITLGIVLIGIMAFSQLKIDLLPDITYPLVTVVTFYPGAGPEEVESYISRPIEEAVALCKNVKTVRSISAENISAVTIEFEWGTNMEFAAFDVREKVDPVIEELPEDAHRPMVIKFEPAAMLPIAFLSISGIEDLRRLREIAEDVVKKDLEKLEGVASVEVMGGLKREILVEVDKKKLAAYNLPLHQVMQALKMENLNIPGGRLEEGKSEFQLRTVGEFQSISEIEEVPLLNFGNQVIRIKDVAKVLDTHKEKRSYARINGKQCVTLLIYKESKANTVEVCDIVKRAIPDIQEKLPSQIEINLPMEQAEIIRKSIHNMESVALEGAILAIVIIFLFLVSFNATLVISISIPLSIITTFVLMYFKGMTFNIVTMGGLTLAIGRIVDDSIVVLESIHRHRKKGSGTLQAAIQGTNEVGMAIAASTFTTIAVFVPIFFVQGITKEFFGSMCLVVAIGLIASLGVALTLIPMVSSLLLKEEEGFSSRSRVLSAWQNGFQKLEGFYRNLLGWSLENRGKVILIAVFIFLVSAFLVPLIGLEYTPKMDVGEIMMRFETPLGTSLAETNKTITEAEKIALEVPEKDTVMATAGSSEEAAGFSALLGRVSSSQSGRIYLKVVDKKKRKRSTEEIKKSILPQLERIPGKTLTFSDPMKMLVGQTSYPIEIDIRGDDIDTLQRLSRDIMAQIRDVPGVEDLDTNWRPGNPEYRVHLDRRKAGIYGIQAFQVASTLEALVRGKEVTKYREGGKEYDITVRARQQDRCSLREIEEAPIYSPGASFIPLKEIATVKMEKGPNFITREESQRMVKIIANKGKRPLNEILRDIKTRIKTKVHFPEGYSFKFAGEEKERRESFSGLFLALFLGIALIYMVLASQFESLIYPFAIMFSIPLEVIGVFLMLLFTGTTLNIISMMGILMLTGIVVSNAILLVDYTNTLRKRGLDRNEAIKEAGPVRLRPVLMTALATICAMIPMALGLREGSEMFQPLAIAVLGGLATSTLLTLIIVPVVYSLLDDLSFKIKIK